MRACLPPVWLLFTCCVPVWPTLSLWPPEKTLNFLFEILAELFKRRTDLDTALCVAYRLSTVLLSQVYTVWGLHLLFAYRSRQRNVCGLSAPRCVSVCVCVGICVCVFSKLEVVAEHVDTAIVKTYFLLVNTFLLVKLVIYFTAVKQITAICLTEYAAYSVVS